MAKRKKAKTKLKAKASKKASQKASRRVSRKSSRPVAKRSAKRATQRATKKATKKAPKRPTKKAAAKGSARKARKMAPKCAAAATKKAPARSSKQSRSQSTAPPQGRTKARRKGRPASLAARSASWRRDGRESRERAGDGNERAFVGTDTQEDEAQELGEEFVRSVTSGEEAERRDGRSGQAIEEEGGPFVVTSASTEYGFGTDASNPADAEKSPFPDVSPGVSPTTDGEEKKDQ